MKKLHISDSLSLPLEFVTSTQAILAKKRVGKSYTASVQAEELLKLEQQICAIDPTGAWYGLKSSADGKRPGFPVVVFGGERADAPLEENAGEIIANALIDQRFSAIIDLSLFRKGAMMRFMAEFLEVLYHKNREAMHLFVDEADLFAPQKPFKGQERTLGAMEDVVRRGGIRGIGCTLITQRSSVINKDVLTQVGLLTVLRLSHPRDIQPIGEWVGVHGEEDQYKVMKASLPSLERGTAWVWAPEWELFEKVQIRARETFDSGATPKAGEVKRRPKVMAEIDVARLGEQIKATIEKAKADDPRALRSEIARLNKELSKRSTEKPIEVKDKIVEVPVLKNEQIERLAKIVEKLVSVSTSFTSALASVRKAPPVAMSRPTPPRVISPPVKVFRKQAESNGDLSGPQIKILSRLFELLEVTGQSSVSKEQLAAWSEYSPNSGGFNNYLGSLRSAGMIEYPSGGMVTLTDAGRSKAQPDTIPVDNNEMLERAKRVLGGSEARILEFVHAAHPESLNKVDIAEAVGFSPNSGGFNNYLGHMRTLGFIDYPQPGMVKASDWLFIA